MPSRDDFHHFVESSTRHQILQQPYSTRIPDSQSAFIESRRNKETTKQACIRPTIPTPLPSPLLPTFSLDDREQEPIIILLAHDLQHRRVDPVVPADLLHDLPPTLHHAVGALASPDPVRTGQITLRDDIVDHDGAAAAVERALHGPIEVIPIILLVRVDEAELERRPFPFLDVPVDLRDGLNGRTDNNLVPRRVHARALEALSRRVRKVLVVFERGQLLDARALEQDPERGVAAQQAELEDVFRMQELDLQGEELADHGRRRDVGKA